MESRDSALDEVRHLVAERQRYDGWLTALEVRRHDTPARVFARVHDDYLARRTEVLVRLQAHVAGLERLAAALHDTVSRLEAEAATLDEERIEAHLRTLVRTIPDLIWLKNAEGVYLACNPRFEEFFGADEADIVGKTDYDFVPKELADSFRAHDRAAMDKGGSVNEEALGVLSQAQRL